MKKHLLQMIENMSNDDITDLIFMQQQKQTEKEMEAASLEQEELVNRVLNKLTGLDFMMSSFINKSYEDNVSKFTVIDSSEVILSNIKDIVKDIQKTCYKN